MRVRKFNYKIAMRKLDIKICVQAKPTLKPNQNN